MAPAAAAAAATAEAVIKAIGAAQAAINALKSAVEFAERSCVIEIDNMTAETLELSGHSHESGAFQKSPPPRIAPFDNALMSSHSTALLQGAVGTVSFTGRNMNVAVDFGNPFVGSNRLDARIAGARAGEFQQATSAGGGDTGAFFRCVITHPIQDNWRFCARCHGMFFNGGDQTNHRCANGNTHLPLGSNFTLTHSVPDGPRMQRNWRFCGKCHGMFFNGPDPANHRCFAGGRHNPLGLVFTLPHDLPPTNSLQTNWRFCGKCHGLFFNGPDAQNHRCPGGDLHNPLGFEFSLPHQP